MRATPLLLLFPENGSILIVHKQTQTSYITTGTSFSRSLRSNRGAKRTLAIHVCRNEQRDVSLSLRDHSQLFADVRFVQEGLRHGKWEAPNQATIDH